MDPVLTGRERSKLDASDDGRFYAEPRFVHHVDEPFRDRLTDLYRDRLEGGWRVLDTMSSWVSHLPPEMEFAHVEGHGMNDQELAENDRLDGYFLRDLNEDPSLPLPDGAFDAALNAVSVQYLQYPGAVFAEMARVLRPGGVAVVSFSNRMFFTKAVRAWRSASDRGRIGLVKRYFDSVDGFGEPEVVAEDDPGRDPFYAVVARRRG